VRRVLTVGAMVTASIALAPAAPSVKDVMKKVGAYVDDYGQRASIVVATEHYTQEVTGNSEVAQRRRFMVADFAIVKIESLDMWQGFRDVLEVDGQRQTDRQDRLLQLLHAAGSDFTEPRRLSDEGARFNIGNIQRNFNVPTTVLFFFRPGDQDRFKFAARRVERDGAWQIAFRETERPTIIRTPWHAPVPSEGEIWVRPDEGTIVRTVLRTPLLSQESSKPRGEGRVDVTYRFVESMAMWLPQSMDEEFVGRLRDGGTERVTGRAAYSNYRKFTTAGRIK
jgi:hypothetical protein